MAIYNAGVLIGNLRKHKGLTQEKLAEGICDRRTISYIERGQISPSRYLFECLLQRLELDPGRFSNYVLSEQETKFERYRLRIENLYKSGGFAEIATLLDELAADAHLQDNRFVCQYLLYQRAALLGAAADWRPEAPYAQIFPLLHEAIALTIPDFDEAQIGGFYSLAELEAMQTLGAAYLFSGSPAQAQRILAPLMALLETEYIAQPERAALYTSLAVTQAKSYRYLHRYQAAYDTAEQGLTICREAQCSQHIPWLLYQKAVAAHLLGQTQEALSLLDDAITIFGYQGETEMVRLCQGRSAEFGAAKARQA